MSKYINLEKQLVRLYRLGLNNEEIVKQFLLTACVEDVEEVRHGRWIDDETAYICSVCFHGSPSGAKWNYCPNCGAKMDGEEE